MSQPEEWLDLCDASGNPLGVRKRKTEVHRDGDWHRSVYLWIITPDHRILLQRRSWTKNTWPGMWDVSVAGHIDAGEDGVGAAVREAHEELGILLPRQALTLIAVVREQGVFLGGTYIENEFHEIYVTRLDVDPASLRLQADEVIDVRLVTSTELKRMIGDRDPELVPHDAEYEAVFAWVTS